MSLVQVVLQLGRGSRAVSGRLVRAPRKGSVVVIEFSDSMHEYVTTPVKRVLRLASRGVFYIETVNSRYRLKFGIASARWTTRRAAELTRFRPLRVVARRPGTAGHPPAAECLPRSASFRGIIETFFAARESAVCAGLWTVGVLAFASSLQKSPREAIMGRFDSRNSQKMSRRERRRSSSGAWLTQSRGREGDAQEEADHEPPRRARPPRRCTG